MSEPFQIVIYLLGLATGLFLGWIFWRLPRLKYYGETEDDTNQS